MNMTEIMFKMRLVVVVFLIQHNVLTYAFINEPGPEPRLKIVQEPDALIIATPSKLNPLYLPCSAAVNIDNQFIEENKWGRNTPNAEDDFDDQDEEDDGEGEVLDNEYHDDKANLNGTAETEEARRIRIEELYRQQFSNLKADDDTSPFRDKNGNVMPDDPINGSVDDDDNEDGDGGLRFSRAIKRSEKKTPQPSVEYTWFRNNEKLLSTSEQQHQTNGFRLFSNGTLKILYTNHTAGIYRCLANETRYGVGIVLSRETTVDVASLMRDPQTSLQQNATRLATMGYPIVLNCPFISYPAANVTWFFNKQPILFDNGYNNIDNRHFLLLNGSLLLAKVKPIDFGKYRCNATNNLTPKLMRSSSITLGEASPTNATKTGLLSSLQNQIQKIHTGQMLKLYCASYSDKITWTFTPRDSHIPIELKNISNELKYVNVSMKKHEGVYNCTTETDYLIYNVTILTPPQFTQKFKSIVSSVAASATFNCSASGNPEPTITWYKNGRLLKNTYAAHFQQNILLLQSIEPEDEGIYQCMAKNDAGEIILSEWLNLRNKHQYKNFPHRPDNLRCYPINYKSVYVTFDTKETFHAVNHYLAKENPYTWLSAPPEPFYANNSFHITDNLLPFTPYALYLRGMVKVESSRNSKIYDRTEVMLTRLSRSAKCATQGLTVYSTTAPNGIFIWWNHFNSVNMTAFTIQFWHNDTANPTVFADQIVGTRKIHADFMDWSEIEANLVKIPATTKVSYTAGKSRDGGLHKKRRVRRSQKLYANVKQILDLPYPDGVDGKKVVADKTDGKIGSDGSNNITITEVVVDGNVSGILIPNSNRISVRVLGTILPNGELVEQDLRYLQWKTIDWSTEKPDAVVNFRVTSIEPRNIQVSWHPVSESDNRCLNICYKNLNQQFIPIRGSSKIDCEEIDSSLTSVTIANLPPATLFKVYLRSCDAPEPISQVLEVQTKQDVPGPVTKQKIVRDEEGIALKWEAPMNANGYLQNYLIEWTNRNGNEVYTTIVEADTTFFRFPNVTSQDKFNITIRAVSHAGLGIPVYVNLFKLSDYGFYERDPSQSKNPLLAIALGITLAFIFISICTWFLVRNRTCKKTRNVNHNSQPLPPGPGTGPGLSPNSMTLNSNHTDLHEMQTLIRKNDLPTLIPNGKSTTGKISLLDNKGKFENCHSEHEKQRVFIDHHVKAYSGIDLSDGSEGEESAFAEPIILTNGPTTNSKLVFHNFGENGKTKVAMYVQQQNHLDSQITGIEVINNKKPSFTSFTTSASSSPLHPAPPITDKINIVATVDDAIIVTTTAGPRRVNSNHFLDYIDPQSSPSSSTISSTNSANTVINNYSPLPIVKKSQNLQQPQHSSIFINNNNKINNNSNNNSSIKSNSNHRIKENSQYLPNKQTASNPDKTSKNLLPQSMSSSDTSVPPLANNNDHFDHHLPNDGNTSPEDVSLYLDDSQQQLLNTSIDSCKQHLTNHNGPKIKTFAPPPSATTTTTTTSNHINNHTFTNGYGNDHDDADDANGVDDYVDQQYDLNDSNLSNKPLYLKWDFRQPIIGPNG